MDSLDNISSRMSGVIAAVLPKVTATTSGRSSGKVDLATAENWLIRPELASLYAEAFTQALTAETLSYPQGLGGDPALRSALAGLFNKYFHPARPVLPEHVVATPGATNCLDALLTTICDEGDSVLIPAPFWSGFNFHFSLRPRVNIIGVRLPIPENVPQQLESICEDVSPCGLIDALTEAYNGAPDPRRVRALVLTNPHNPFGMCYPAEVLRACLDFCTERNLHYISDEVYGLSVIPGVGSSGGSRFTSALSLLSSRSDDQEDPSEIVTSECTSTPADLASSETPDGQQYQNCEGPHTMHTIKEDERQWNNHNGLPSSYPNRGAQVHVIWSTSKDLGSSGVRMAAVVSQSPEARPIRTSISLLSSLQLSTLTSLATTHLLTSPRFGDLVSLNAARLSIHHDIACAALQRWGVPFLRAEAGPFVFARLGAGSYSKEKTGWIRSRRDEQTMMQRLGDAGVLVTPGSEFGGWGLWGGSEEDVAGWARITIAVPCAQLREGLDRIAQALNF